ncbi:hypothetical protein F0L74_21010 [Chitinophaga agrisoli]|uniref:Uncharacterized protein n=1 Tax=Chitinophaga agrisoli TaxID=2607653 RepID=A0A5B2VHZ8_9BACT|nr:hypothetical protein [Chitinophaga agrisoli]KAA2238701.1 hypothetical protein F0L74_21010 [Chitinophaga agrisoli]
MITGKANVHNVMVTVWPGRSDSFKTSRSLAMNLPGSFNSGGQWQLVHKCQHCDADVTIGNGVGNTNYIAGGNLHIASLPYQPLLDQIGQLFNLELVSNTDSNGKFIHYYNYPKQALTSCSFIYYKCQQCNTQYLMCYTEVSGRERPPEPDSIYIIGIMEVAFDEAAFMEKFNNKR